MKQFTDITVLLDRSGSMEDIKSQMESAYNEFLKGHQAVPSTRVSLVQFDSHSTDTVYSAIPVKDAPRLTLEPRGGTPLLDALCTTIDSTGERLWRMGPTERPDSVLFVIITDGQENSSHRFTRRDVNERVTKQMKSFQWQFLYLGANQDAFTEAASYGIPMGQTLNYAASNTGVQGMSVALVKTMDYAQRVNRGMAIQDFSTEDRIGAAE